VIQMKKVREIDNNKFEIRTVIDGKIIDKKEINYKIFNKTIDEKTYYILYDSKMKIIHEVFRFVNFYNANSSQNTKEYLITSLKYLYTFEEIISKNLIDFKAEDFVNLQRFLKGYSFSGAIYSFENLTERKNNTVNMYMSCYRKYFKFLNINNNYLFSVQNISSSVQGSLDTNYKISKYDSNLSVSKPIYEVPRYIDVESFSKIIQCIRKDYSVREECIVRLMFEAGLRIGECLGLTNEDICQEKDENGEFKTVIYIRNRVSDKKYQHAKTSMKVFSKNDYKGSEYNTENLGYQIAGISNELYDLIGEYIEEEHIKARKSHQKNYDKYTITDSISGNENFYIFLNSLGKPISINTWNSIIREIFIKCNIPVDYNVKKHNINHRFRHGFAMFQIQYMKRKELELMVLMRHSSLSSVTKYYCPTIHDQIELKNQFIENLYDVLPELKANDMEDK